MHKGVWILLVLLLAGCAREAGTRLKNGPDMEIVICSAEKGLSVLSTSDGVRRDGEMADKCTLIPGWQGEERTWYCVRTEKEGKLLLDSSMQPLVQVGEDMTILTADTEQAIVLHIRWLGEPDYETERIYSILSVNRDGTVKTICEGAMDARLSPTGLLAVTMENESFMIVDSQGKGLADGSGRVLGWRNDNELVLLRSINEGNVFLDEVWFYDLARGELSPLTDAEGETVSLSRFTQEPVTVSEAWMAYPANIWAGDMCCPALVSLTDGRQYMLEEYAVQKEEQMLIHFP